MTYTWTYLKENPTESKRLLGISYENLIELIELGKNLNNKAKKNREAKN